DAHALGWRRDATTGREGRLAVALLDPGQGLEGVDHVLEVDGQDALELGADGLLELWPAEALEREVEHVDEHPVTAEGGIGGVVLEATGSYQLADHRGGALLVGGVAGRDPALDDLGEHGAPEAGSRDRHLDAVGPEIDAEDAARHAAHFS